MKFSLFFLCAIMLFGCRKKSPDPVVIVKSNNKAILSFTYSINGVSNAALVDTVARTILVSFPYKTTNFSVTPAIQTSTNATILPSSGTLQDLSNELVYTITAENGTTTQYTVQKTILPKATVNFLVIGDWGFGDVLTPSLQKNVADQMDLASKNDDIDFIMTVGDNFYEYGVSSTTDPIWKTAYENIYTGANLQVNWYAALGNHDYTGTGQAQAQVDYTKISNRWKMPSRYYSFTKPIIGKDSVLFVCIDGTPFMQAYKTFGDAPQQDTNAQLAWLESTLKQSTARWKIVYGHYPVYSSGGHSSNPEMIQVLRPILDKYQVDAYIAGHDHNMEHLRIPDLPTEYIVSGGGASAVELYPFKNSYSVFVKKSAGFASIQLSSDSLKMKYIDQDGALLYNFAKKHL